MSKISLYEHCVRRIRQMRVSGESEESIQLTLKNLQRNIAIDPEKLLAEAAKPGPIDGTPFLAAAKIRAGVQ